MSSILESQLQAAEQEWLDYWKRGSTRIRWTKLSLQVRDAARDFALLDSTGKTVRLHDFFGVMAGRAVVLEALRVQLWHRTRQASAN
jgi:hypothetical protein